MRNFVEKLNQENKVSSMSFLFDEENNRVEVVTKEYKGKPENYSTDAQIDYLRRLPNVTWRSNNCINSTNKWQLSNVITIAKNNPSINFFINN